MPNRGKPRHIPTAIVFMRSTWIPPIMELDSTFWDKDGSDPSGDLILLQIPTLVPVSWSKCCDWNGNFWTNIMNCIDAMPSLWII
jgi:hypothetical protein